MDYESNPLIFGEVMDLNKICPIRSNRADGYVVMIEGSKNWYHLRNLNKLIKFVNKTLKKGKKFKIYHCNSKKELSKKMVKKILKVGKIEKEELFLDDN